MREGISTGILYQEVGLEKEITVQCENLLSSTNWLWNLLQYYLWEKPNTIYIMLYLDWDCEGAISRSNTQKDLQSNIHF